MLASKFHCRSTAVALSLSRADPIVASSLSKVKLRLHAYQDTRNALSILTRFVAIAKRLLPQARNAGKRRGKRKATMQAPGKESPQVRTADPCQLPREADRAPLERWRFPPSSMLQPFEQP